MNVQNTGISWNREVKLPLKGKRKCLPTGLLAKNSNKEKLLFSFYCLGIKKEGYLLVYNYVLGLTWTERAK